IFGWKRLKPWTHFWAGVPIVICGIGGAFSVVAVNSWMNQPQGFTPTSGDVTSVEPLKVIFNPAVPYEVPHMILAAYLVTGFLVGWSTDTEVTGLDTVASDDRPPANTMLHWAFDTMVGICTALIALGAWLAFVWWRRRDIPRTKWFLRAVAVSGVSAVVALECG